jgi:hypothetical protein
MTLDGRPFALFTEDGYEVKFRSCLRCDNPAITCGALRVPGALRCGALKIFATAVFGLCDEHRDFYGSKNVLNGAVTDGES